jgi:hypothetical protein
MYTFIELEDNGQDFLTVITDCNGIIVETRPFQSNIWKGATIPIESVGMMKPGQLLPIHNPPHIRYGFLKHKIEKVFNQELLCELPDFRKPVLANCKGANGNIETHVIQRIKTKDTTKEWQWSSIEIDTYFTLEVVSWQYIKSSKDDNN